MKIPKRKVHKPYWNKEWLLDEYVIQEREADDIAGQCGVTKTAVLNMLKKFDIPIRSQKTYWPQPKHVSFPHRFLKGEDNPSWKGGPDLSTRTGLYSSQQWKKTKQIVLQRDKNTCQRCNILPVRIKIHHIIPFHWGIGGCDPGCCISLCGKCHAWVHSIKNVNLEFLASPIEEKVYDPRLHQESS